MQELSGRYPVWFCDIWGVIHNGYSVFAKAIDALQRHRANEGTVVLVTNSPRTSEGVEKQLHDVGVPRDCWDAIATSGDVTRILIAQHGGGLVFHVGPGRDHSLFAGLDARFVELSEAESVVCTGLFDETRETPDDYKDLLRDMKQRNLPFICANPDKVVRKGERLLYCAGAIADLYSAYGGNVLMAGKPFAPIYDLALKRVGVSDLGHVLAIGDGPETDIRGASNYGLPVVLITGGINDKSIDIRSAVLRAAPGARVLKAIPELVWNTV